MTIREMENEDIPELVKMISFHKKNQNFTITKEFENTIFEGLKECLKNKLSRIFVALTSTDKIMGYINCHFISFPMMPGKEIYISDLLIHPEYRGSGAGSKLLSKSEDYARSKGCKRLMLNNQKTEESYKREFYKKQGFKERQNFANFVKQL